MKPKIVISACLGFAPCRYDGRMARHAGMRNLKRHVDFQPVCPEVAIGLGVPRKKIRLVRTAKGALRLVQPATNKDLTARMRKFSRSFLGSLGNVDGFILKSKSPSCGIGNVRIYGSAKGRRPVSKGPGFFAAEVMRKFPGLPIWDEHKLRDVLKLEVK